jgi:hypothetical protein
LNETTKEGGEKLFWLGGVIRTSKLAATFRRFANEDMRYRCMLRHFHTLPDGLSVDKEL